LDFNIGDRVRFKNFGKFKSRDLFPPPSEGSTRVHEGDLGTVVWTRDERTIYVRPDNREHIEGPQSGWAFRAGELEAIDEPNPERHPEPETPPRRSARRRSRT
jgi:hypothetical protein